MRERKGGQAGPGEFQHRDASGRFDWEAVDILIEHPPGSLAGKARLREVLVGASRACGTSAGSLS